MDCEYSLEGLSKVCVYVFFGSIFHFIEIGKERCGSMENKLEDKKKILELWSLR